MNKIPVTELREGLLFTRPAFIEGDSLFMIEGVALKQSFIDRLNHWGITEVETDGELVAPSAYSSPATGSRAPVSPQGVSRTDPPLPDSLKIEAAVSQQPPAPAFSVSPPTVFEQELSSKTRAEWAAFRNGSKSFLSLAEVKEPSGTYRNYIALITWLDRIFRNITARLSADTRFIDSMTSRILNLVRDDRSVFINFILGGEVQGHELAKNSLNTAILSAHIAQEMRLPNHRIMLYITAALLHDVGMLRLPQELVNKADKLTKDELQRIRSHTLYAYKIVHEELNYPEDLGQLVMQHHERWDGTGYPQGLKGVEIHQGARIISVADAFEAMVSHKPYRNSMIGYQAMKNLLADNSLRFDPDVVKAFIKIMGVYPIGSIILLNNGFMARVVEVRGDAPLRPKIAVLIDETGQIRDQANEEIIDLLSEKSLFIVRAINPKELSKGGI